ncbi:MAG: hypothetical protein QG652_1178 [Pseudomonadota bacterium]|nr:hypothetical protein [Pseudomonadota bacterium]
MLNLLANIASCSSRTAMAIAPLVVGRISICSLSSSGITCVGVMGNEITASAGRGWW